MKTVLLSFTFLFISLILTSHELIITENEQDINIREFIFDNANVIVPDSVDENHLMLMYQKAVELNIPFDIIFRMIKRESNFNPTALSSKNAQGYMQIIPGTWNYLLKRFNLPSDTPKTPEWNITIGTAYIDYLRSYWLNRGLNENLLWDYVLASYNAGKKRVIDYGGIPPFEETIKYVTFVNRQRI